MSRVVRERIRMKLTEKLMTSRQFARRRWLMLALLIIFSFFSLYRIVIPRIRSESKRYTYPTSGYALEVQSICGKVESKSAGFGAQLWHLWQMAGNYRLHVFRKLDQSIGIEHELLRRRAARMAKEIWLVSQAKYPPPNSVIFPPFSRNKAEETVYEMSNPFRRYLAAVSLSLMVHLDRLGQADGVNIPRVNGLNHVSCSIALRLSKLQNPRACNRAKILLVDLSRPHGLTCQVHYLMFCLQLAYATGRTMLLRPRNHSFQNWWVENFEPFSDRCTEESFADEEPVQDLDLQTLYSDIRVLYCRYELCFKARHISIAPPALPDDMASLLQELHGQPAAWFAGQLAKYVFRPRGMLKMYVDQVKKLHRVEKPDRPAIVGVHVRRTDKITWSEGHRHPLREYMTHVSRYFDFLKEQHRTEVVMQGITEDNDARWSENATTGPHAVFIATDDPTVFDEAKAYRSQFTILGSPSHAVSAAVRRRREEISRRNAVADIIMLSHTDFIVCTMSSHVCRLAYELMQTRHQALGDASSRVHSLDTAYYYDQGQPNSCRMYLDDEVIGLSRGQVVGVWSGNLNSRREGSAYRNKTVFMNPTYKCEPRIFKASMDTH